MLLAFGEVKIACEFVSLGIGRVMSLAVGRVARGGRAMSLAVARPRRLPCPRCREAYPHAISHSQCVSVCLCVCVSVCLCVCVCVCVWWRQAFQVYEDDISDSKVQMEVVLTSAGTLYNFLL